MELRQVQLFFSLREVCMHGVLKQHVTEEDEEDRVNFRFRTVNNSCH